MSYLNRWGWTVRGTTFDEKNDEEFIENLREVLEIPEIKDNFGRKIPKLQIFRGNAGIISDIENVGWQKWKSRDYDLPKDKLDITSRDFLATLKYNLATPITLSSSKTSFKRSARRSPWAGRPQKVVIQW